MDIDHIRYMISNGMYRTTLEFDQRTNQREFSLDQVKEVIRSGRIVREETKQRKGYPKCTIRGETYRDITKIRTLEKATLEVACAVGDEVILITAYWVYY